jgi:hypothetical protein
MRPPESEHTIEDLYRFAALEMRKGRGSEDIANSLINRNVEAEKVAVVVKAMRKAESNVLRAAGKKNMLFGALWFVGGVIVTAATYQLVAGAGGGKFIIAWGAIAFGAIQFIRGFNQYSGDSGE